MNPIFPRKKIYVMIISALAVFGLLHLSGCTKATESSNIETDSILNSASIITNAANAIPSTLNYPKDSHNLTLRLIHYADSSLNCHGFYEAYYYLNEALDNCPINTPDLKAKIYLLLTKNQIIAGNENSADVYLNTAHNILISINNDTLKALYFSNAANTWAMKKHISKSIELQMISLRINKRLGLEAAIAQNYNDIAIDTTNFLNNINNLNQSIIINKRLNNWLKLAQNYDNLAYQYLNIRKLNFALNASDSALVYIRIEMANGKKLLSTHYSRRAGIYYALGKYKETAEYLLLARNTENLEYAKLKDYENLLNDIRIQNEKYKLKNAQQGFRIKSMVKTIVIVIFIAAIILLGFSFVFFYYRSKRSMLVLNNEKEQIELENIYNKNELSNLANYQYAISNIFNLIIVSLREILKTDEPSKTSEIRKLLMNVKNIHSKSKGINDPDSRFAQINKDFVQKLSKIHPELTKNDLHIASLLRADLSSKQISIILDISENGVNVARYRMRRHLKLNNTDNLVQYLKNIENK